MLKSESIAALAKAIALSQLHVENALKSSTNPHFKSKYADLAEILNTVRPVFSANGIAIVQTPTLEDDDGQQAVAPPLRQAQPERKLSNAEREMGVKDMRAAVDENALKQVWADYHAMAKNIGDRESVEFFTDCAKECKAAFQ